MIRYAKIQLLYRVVLTVLALSLSGCGYLTPIRTAPPQGVYLEAQLSGIPYARVWGDETPANAAELIAARRELQKARYKSAGSPPEGIELSYLAISGGAADGAYGAGVLNGWTQTGARPDFEVVTGVSTGALIAPFAFLGKEYDDKLQQAFTTISDDDIAVPQVFSALFGALAVADTTPLQLLIAQFVDSEMLAQIAVEHAKGRRLLVGTTNLDAQRPVIWNMGEIAASDRPDKLDLFRSIVLASASIPGAFEPVPIEVVASGRRFTENHVDGGVTAAVFFLPFSMRVGELVDDDPNVRHRLYIIQNNKMVPAYEPVAASLPNIVGRSISTLIRTQGLGDLIEIYLASRRDGFNYSLTFIPPEFDAEAEAVFDTKYMNTLYEFGLLRALDENHWAEAPPGVLAPKKPGPDQVAANRLVN